jgi:hypothetical protein
MFRATVAWALLLLAAAASPCAAQGIGARAVVMSAPGYAQETRAVIAATLAAGGPAPSVPDALIDDRLIKCLHDFNTGDPWDVTDAIYPLAGPSLQQSLLNYVNPYGTALTPKNCTGGASPDGGPTWTQYKGSHSNGNACVGDASGNFMSYYETNIAGGGSFHFQRDGANMAIVVATGTVPQGNSVLAGSANSAIWPMRGSTTDFGGRPNATATTVGGTNVIWKANQVPAPSAGPGYYDWDRTSSSGGDATDPAGVLESSTALGGWGGASIALANTFWIFGENVGGTCCGGFVSPLASQIVSMVDFGGAETQQQEATQYACFKAWMVARGLP